MYTEKSAGIAVLLSLIIPGAGQMYAGKVGRGVALLILAWFLIPAFVILFLWIFIESTGFAWLILSFLVIIFYIFVLYDAYSVAKEYNTFLRLNGQPPW